MGKYDFYRTDLLDESEEMVRHRTESEKNTIERSGRYFIWRIQIRTCCCDFCHCRRGRRKKNREEKGSYITLTVPALTTPTMKKG